MTLYQVTVTIRPVTGAWSQDDHGRLVGTVGIEAPKYADALRQLREMFPLFDHPPVGLPERETR